MGWGLDPCNMSLSPSNRETGWSGISGSVVRKFSNFDRFCGKKTINNLYKLLRLLGDFVAQAPTGASPLDPINYNNIL